MKKFKLKPFDLKKAKAGHAICTRNNKFARIICFDRMDDRSLVVLVSTEWGEESFNYLINGSIGSGINDLDLFMFHGEKKKKERKEGWINIYKDKDYLSNRYDTKEEALIGRGKMSIYVTTIKIKWKEKVKES